jgi:hypothetical protein
MSERPDVRVKVNGDGSDNAEEQTEEEKHPGQELLFSNPEQNSDKNKNQGKNEKLNDHQGLKLSRQR